jgi:hypothetical protein
MSVIIGGITDDQLPDGGILTRSLIPVYIDPGSRARPRRSLTRLLRVSDRGGFLMCRSIRPLHNYDPPTTAKEVDEAALQYVRKISGMRQPARGNQEAFERAVAAVAEASNRLLEELVAHGPPRSRAREIERARERAAVRFAAPAA